MPRVFGAWREKKQTHNLIKMKLVALHNMDEKESGRVKKLQGQIVVCGFIELYLRSGTYPYPCGVFFLKLHKRKNRS